MEQGILEPQIPTYSTERQRKVGDFKFVIIKEQPADLIVNDKLSSLDRRLIGGRIYLQKITASPISWYGLEFSNVIEESSPLFITQAQDQYLIQKKIYHRGRLSKTEK